MASGIEQSNERAAPLFDADGLRRLESWSEYRNAKPFPHLVIDGLFSAEALRGILTEWPPSEQSDLEIHDDGEFVRGKVATTWRSEFSRQTRLYFGELSGPRFLRTLETVTGMWGLMGDPYMFGGGLHATGVGGRLAIHADYNRHPIFKVDRRLNLLVYLNEGWTEENGGRLELWDREMTKCVVSVLPVFNRTVLFTTSRTSWHGQPEPISGPPGLMRKSLALYYFSNGRADEGYPPDCSDEHTTLWRERPGAGY